MNRLIKYYSIPIKKKAAMLDWLFGHKKIIIVVDTFDCKMMLFCHGQYVEDDHGEIIKLPNIVSPVERHFRYQMPCKFYVSHELHNSIECKAKWLDAILKRSKSGHWIRHGHELLLHLDYFTYTNDIVDDGDLITSAMDTGIYLPPFASRTSEARILLRCFVRCIRSFTVPQLDLRIGNPFFGKTHILSLPYDVAKVTVDLDFPCNISKDVEHKIAAKEHEKKQNAIFL